MILTRKFFRSLSLLLILTLSIFGTAAAKSQAEISSINAYEIAGEILRIEVAFNGNLDMDDVSARPSGNTFSIALKNTTPGRISRIAGTKIENSNLLKKITVKEAEKNNTRVRLLLTAPITKEAYKISVQPANRAEKIPSRVVVDINKTLVNFSGDKDNFHNFRAEDKVVVLDAGHGGSDTGAVGPSGVTEKSVALAIALKTEKILQNEGMKVVMTRRTDIDVASPNASNVAELQARVDKIPPQADIFISIHCNAFSNPKSHGMETYHYGADNGGKRLAQLLNEELAKYGGLTNRGVKAANFYVLKRSNRPASLIEIGFITNPDEEKLLASNDYQNKLAAAIASAVKKFFMN